MKIDNINLIKNLLNFEKDGDFYYCLILKRKKDQPEEERDNHQSVRTIKTYCIESLEYLDKRYEEMKMLCEVFSARAYIHVQKQNHHLISLEMIEQLAKRLKSGVVRQNHLFDSVVGQIPFEERRWIVDVDSKDKEQLDKVIFFINNECRPLDTDKVIETIPTKNGYHLITSKFDVITFKEKYSEVEIQKKNPTLLYFPDSLDLLKS
jgi:hypothetical protein